MPGSVRGAQGATGRQVPQELALLSPPPAPPPEFWGWVEGQGTGSQEKNRMQSGPEIGQPQMLSGISAVWVLNEAHQNPAFHSSLPPMGTKSRRRLDCPIVPVASNFGRAGLGGGGRAAPSTTRRVWCVPAPRPHPFSSVLFCGFSGIPYTA